MLAHVSQGFWESFCVVVRLFLCGAFGVTAIIGAMIWYDARSKRDWWHVMLGRFITLIALAGTIFSALVVRP